MRHFVFIFIWTISTKAHAIFERSTCKIRLSNELASARAASTWSVRDQVAILESPRLKMEIHPQSNLKKVVKIYTQEGVYLGDFFLRLEDRDSGGIRVGPLSITKQGYATEARFYLSQYMFNQYPIKRIKALIQPENTASIRLHTKLGFQQDPSQTRNWTQSVEAFRALELRLASDPDFSKDFFTARNPH